MKSDDPDPVWRWREVAEFFAAWSGEVGWGHLAPMAALADWLSLDALGARLYPTTSVGWLLVEMLPGFDFKGGRPSVACRVLRDETFECELKSAAGEVLERRLVPVGQGREAFAALAGRLLNGEGVRDGAVRGSGEGAGGAGVG